MAKYETKSIFYVYQVRHNNAHGAGEQALLTLVHDPYQHGGHISYGLAKEWIENHDESGQYTILEIFKKV